MYVVLRIFTCTILMIKCEGFQIKKVLCSIDILVLFCSQQDKLEIGACNSNSTASDKLVPRQNVRRQNVRGHARAHSDVHFHVPVHAHGHVHAHAHAHAHVT